MVVCKKCGWNTKTTSRRAWITCSSCQTKVKNDLVEFAKVQGVAVEITLSRLRQRYNQYVEDVRADPVIENGVVEKEPTYEEWLVMFGEK